MRLLDVRRPGRPSPSARHRGPGSAPPADPARTDRSRHGRAPRCPENTDAIVPSRSAGASGGRRPVGDRPRAPAPTSAAAAEHRGGHRARWPPGGASRRLHRTRGDGRKRPLSVFRRPRIASRSPATSSSPRLGEAGAGAASRLQRPDARSLSAGSRGWPARRARAWPTTTPGSPGSSPTRGDADDLLLPPAAFRGRPRPGACGGAEGRLRAALPPRRRCGPANRSPFARRGRPIWFGLPGNPVSGLDGVPLLRPRDHGRLEGDASPGGRLVPPPRGADRERPAPARPTATRSGTLGRESRVDVNAVRGQPRHRRSRPRQRAHRAGRPVTAALAGRAARHLPPHPGHPVTRGGPRRHRRPVRPPGRARRGRRRDRLHGLAASVPPSSSSWRRASGGCAARARPLPRDPLRAPRLRSRPSTFGARRQRGRLHLRDLRAERPEGSPRRARGERPALRRVRASRTVARRHDRGRGPARWPELPCRALVMVSSPADLRAIRPKPWKPGAVRQVRLRHALHPPRVSRHTRLSATPRGHEAVSHLAMPKLIVTAEGDWLVDPSHGRRLARAAAPPVDDVHLNLPGYRCTPTDWSSTGRCACCACSIDGFFGTPLRLTSPSGLARGSARPP